MIIVSAVFFVLALVVMKLMLHGPFSPYGLTGGFTVGFIALFIMGKLGCYLTLTNTKVISRSAFPKFSPNQLLLSEVSEVRRERLNTFLAFGEVSMTISTRSGQYVSIGEPFYSTKTLRSFLLELSARTPHLVMDTQYQALIDGKLPATEAFKKIPTSHVIELYGSTDF